MRNLFKQCLGGVLVLLISHSVWASTVPENDRYATTTVRVDQKFVPHSGGAMWVAVQLNLIPGWHTYAPDVESSFKPPQFSLESVQGKVLDVRYPKGQIYSAYGKRYLIYADSATIFVKLQLSDHQKNPSNNIKLTMHWLACTESTCVPQRTVLQIPIRYSDQQAPTIHFRDIHQQLSDSQFSGLEASSDSPSIWGAVLLAVIGGFILNLMPCVFPVLSLKVFQVLKIGGESARQVRGELGYYSLGVLATFWVLALVTIGFHMFGKWVGWGFQLQSPIFVGVMAIVFLCSGLLMLDWLKLPAQWIEGITTLTGRIPIGRIQSDRRWHSFWTGFLAVAVATPCTAPFMSTALAFALSQSAWVIMLIFTGLGLGMVMPFLVLWVWPQCLAWMPKPGPWMVITKRILAIPMIITALWLIMVAYRQIHPVMQVGSVTQLRQLLAQQQPVLVDVTAQWCLTCKVNEKVLKSETVTQMLNEKGVRLLVLDWTDADPGITQFLKSHGRAGVPAYFYFDGQSPTPTILPQVLTPAIINNALEINP